MLPQAHPATEPVYFARVSAGLEQLAWGDIERHTGARLLGLGHRRVDFACAAAPAGLLALRAVDDVYVRVARLRGLDHTRASLGRLTRKLGEVDFDPALALIAQVRTLPEYPMYRVTASHLGRRNYSRYDIEGAVEQALTLRLPWRFVLNAADEPMPDLDLRVLLEDDWALLGLRLGDVTERKEREINAREQLNAERRLHQEIEAVQQAGLSLIVSLDLHQVFSSILKTLYDLFPVRVADIFLYENDTLTFGLGMRPEGLTTQPYSVPRQDGFTYTVARSAQPSFIEDNAQHPVLKHIRPAWEQFSMAGLPLLIKSEVVGVMDVSYDAPHYFSEKEKQLLQLLAVYAAIAVQNARLHGQVQHQTELLEQRVAERTAELEQERSWLRTILDTAGEAIYFADADKVIRYANAMTEHLTGYPADELVGQPHHLLRGALDTITQQTVATTLARGDVWQGEVLNRHKEGRLYDANVTLSPVRNTHHDVVGYVGIERDITQTKELYRLREQFVSRIGHELRTPLTNLQVYVQLLKHGQPDKQARYIAVLEETTTRLRKLIEGFMELSALSVDAAPVQLTPVDAHEVVMHLIQGEQMKSRAHHLALVYKRGGELTPVLAESALLRQLMARLLENAFDYTPANGQVTVTMTRELWQGQEWVVIAVQDTGPGIVAAELPHIFDRFFRGNAAADYTVAGAGLGLAICQEIIQKLGGRLTVASTVGVGTIFYVWRQPASAPFN